MSDFIDSIFRAAGRASAKPCSDCPDDETFGAYQDVLLSATAQRAIQDHALECLYTQSVLTSLADQRAAAERVQPGLRIVARLARRGLALLNAAELTLRGLTAQPLGALRGDETCPLLRIVGPGQGLDEIELQTQADGSIRCVVSGQLHEQPEGQQSTVVLEVDGKLREKRPFSGDRLSFGPLTGGSCRITLLARRPGEAAREISAAVLDLVA